MRVFAFHGEMNSFWRDINPLLLGNFFKYYMLHIVHK
jgi:hypothetical protein